MNTEQNKIISETNLLDLASSSSSTANGATSPFYSPGGTPTSFSSNRNALSASKLSSINTIKTKHDTIACGLSNGGITLYKVQNNGKASLTCKLTNHKRTINSLDFLNETSYDATNQFISGSQDGTIKLWDLRASATKPMISVSSASHLDPIRSCQYSPHLSVSKKITILSVHDSGALYKYDLRQIGPQLQPLQQHTNLPERKWNFHTGPALSLHIHPEKEYVITGGRDQKLCVWNYSESEYRTLPDFIINTYGPILKVRWNLYPNLDEVPVVDETENNLLFNYDIACTYLNDDPTITVYNLKRKYIPKEIIKTSTKPFQNFIWGRHPKKTRNVWTITKANQFASYSLDKEYDGQIPDNEISKPLDNLKNISVAWGNSMGDFTFINQEKYEFENTDTETPQHSQPLHHQQGHHSHHHHQVVTQEREEYDMDLAMTIEGNTEGGMAQPAVGGGTTPIGTLFGSDSTIDEIDREPVGSPIGTIPIATNSSPVNIHSTMTSSFLSTHEIKRGGTTVPMSSTPSSGAGYNNSSMITTPIPHRPSLNRNPTQESILSAPSPLAFNNHHQTQYHLLLLQQLQQQMQRKLLSVTYPSPYLVPISLPVQLNDETIFETLSTHYLISIPDGFTLIDVCVLNANVAASVNKFRDCQVWRVLAVSLEEEGILRGTFDSIGMEEVNQLDTISTFMNGKESGQTDDDDRSIILELDNFVGSFNSNSTLNYGGGGGSSTTEKEGLNASPERARKLSSKSFSEQRNGSSGNLMDMIHNSRNAFPNSISPIATRSNSMLNKTQSVFRNTETDEQDENAIMDDDDDDEETKEEEPKEEKQQREVKNVKEEKQETTKETFLDDISSNQVPDESYLRKHSSLPVMSPNKLSKISTSPPLENQLQQPHSATASGSRRLFGDSPTKSGRPSFGRPSFGTGKRPTAEDLDDENMNVLSAAGYGSFSSSGKSIASSPTFFNHLPHSTAHSHHKQPILNHGSFSSRRNSNSIFGGRLGAVGAISSSSSKVNGKEEPLEQVEEEGGGSVVASPSGPSQLTMAINNEDNRIRESTMKAEQTLSKPWKTKCLLEEALNYSTLQGDILMCSTLALLFYKQVISKSEEGESSITKDNCLEWLALYIEILRKKQLFVTAMKVINESPTDLKAELNRICGNDVSLRFYCTWCNKLLVNEESKMKFKTRQAQQATMNGLTGADDNFGYWYCDECSKKQPGCVYCNEPCKGLNVVVSLRCGHRGHFGCLREWFVEDQNIDCPGGCDVVIM